MEKGIPNPLLIKAIREKRRLSFRYAGGSTPDATYIVELQCYGVGHRGSEQLRAYRVLPDPKQEKLYEVSKMKDLVLLDEHFAKPGPNYKKNDSAMKIIFAQL